MMLILSESTFVKFDQMLACTCSIRWMCFLSGSAIEVAERKMIEAVTRQ